MSYNQELLDAVAGLNSAKWGDFFFVMPVVITPTDVVPVSLLRATSVRVFIPDTAIQKADPIYGRNAWDTFGAIGLKTYPGRLIPLQVVRENNPSFDYHTILCSAMRRQEYETMCLQHMQEMQAILKSRGV